MGLKAQLEAHGFLKKHAARFVLGEDGVEDTFDFANALRAERAPYAYQVKRLEFDGLLQRFAVEGGAKILWDVTVQDVDLEDTGGVLIKSRDGRSFRCRYLVDASGPSSLLARSLTLREPLPGLNKVALFSHFEGVPRRTGKSEGDIVILWSENGWFWIIPFTGGITSVGAVGNADLIQSMGTDDASRFDRLCDQSATHREYLGERRQLFPLQRRADYSFRLKTLSGERFVLVGDASGFIDPIFSSGVFLAQNGAFLARDLVSPALRSGRLPDPAAREHYEARVRLGVDRFLGLVRQFYDNRFIENAVRSRTRPELKRALISILAGDVYHEENVLIRMGLL
jgi:flavin-dependent dehydrogenase